MMNRAAPIYWIALLVVICFSLAVTSHPFAETYSRSAQSGSVLKLLLGDGRRMFANQIFAQADISFHSGYYPSIFDAPVKTKTEAMSGGAAHHDEEEHEREMALNQAHDWIEAFGRNFRVTQHTHLAHGQEREILPWLRVSADLDPQRVETYTVASYWLRKRLGKAKEAEQFLREGLRSNPGSPEILFELGSLYAENLHEIDHARNVWELALNRWNVQEAGKREPNLYLLEQISVHLGKLEEQAGNLPRAIGLLELARKASPKPDELQKQIEELKSRLPK